MARAWIGTRPPPPPEPGAPCTGLCHGVAGATCTWEEFHNTTRVTETVTGPCPTCGGTGTLPD